MPAHQGKINTSTEEEKLLRATRATYLGPRIPMPAHQGKINTSTEDEQYFTGNAGHVS
jgi:hypothetical protein